MKTYALGSPIPDFGRFEPDYSDPDAILFERASATADLEINDAGRVAEAFDSKLLPETLAQLITTAHAIPRHGAYAGFRDLAMQMIGEKLCEAVWQALADDAEAEMRACK